MATVSASLSFCTICRANCNFSPSPSCSLTIPLRPVRLKSYVCIANYYPNSSLVKNFPKLTRIRSMEDEATLIPEQVEEGSTTEEEEKEASTTDEAVSVPVSPSDVLTMFFQAEGTMNEAAIPKVTNALEETEGISNLRVQVFEGIATVELTKQTTVQATGVASRLVEVIQGSGFKLQALNLSFEDEDDLN